VSLYTNWDTDEPNDWNGEDHASMRLDDGKWGDNKGLLQGGIIEVVPIPAAAWLLGAGVIGLVVIRRRFTM